MARDLFAIEKGLHILSTDGVTGVAHLFGSASPGGTTDTDAAEVGSIYGKTADGSQWKKITAGSGTDKWTEITSEPISTITGVTTVTTLDSVLVDNVFAVKWYVQIFEEATPANVIAEEVFAVHNGTAAADATSADDTVYAKLKLGSTFNHTVTVDLNGTGAAQVLRLRVASTSAGVTARARREIVGT